MQLFILCPDARTRGLAPYRLVGGQSTACVCPRALYLTFALFGQFDTVALRCNANRHTYCKQKLMTKHMEIKNHKQDKNGEYEKKKHTRKRTPKPPFLRRVHLNEDRRMECGKWTLVEIGGADYKNASHFDDVFDRSTLGDQILTACSVGFLIFVA